MMIEVFSARFTGTITTSVRYYAENIQKKSMIHNVDK